jgi:hypothetical protein
MPRKHTIKDMQIIAFKHKGLCLSDKYINLRTKLHWSCKLGHKWDAIPHHINRGHWCPVCAGITPLTLKEMKALAKNKGGKCLSKKYLNNRTRLLWECNEGHKWMAQPSNIKLGNWCKKCAGLSNITIQELKKIAIKAGGRLLSKEVTNNDKKLRWECGEGHRWLARPRHIKSSKSWCPICSKHYINEELVRDIFEKIYKRKFPKSRPVWLIGIKGRLLELDGYNKKLCLAFEYHGDQHYNCNNYIYKRSVNTGYTFKQRVDADSLKKQLCLKNGVKLIVIPCTIKPEDYRKYILNKVLK